MKQMFAHTEEMTAAAAQAAGAPSYPFCPTEILMDTTFVVSIFVALGSTWCLLVPLWILLLIRLRKVLFGRAHC